MKRENKMTPSQQAKKDGLKNPSQVAQMTGQKNQEITMKTTLIVSSGQYETAAVKVVVNHKTWSGLCRRITQLKNEHAVYGDNWAGWIKANVALASENDKFGDNNIIGGQWCEPANGWLVDPDQECPNGLHMTYPELRKRLGL